jgi:hypothetical protein
MVAMVSAIIRKKAAMVNVRGCRSMFFMADVMRFVSP